MAQPRAKTTLLGRSDGAVQTMPLPDGYALDLNIGAEMTSQKDANGQTYKFFRCFVRHPLPPAANGDAVFERVQFSTPANVHMSILRKPNKDYQYACAIWFWSAGEKPEPRHLSWIEGAERAGQALRDLIVQNQKAVKMLKDASLGKVTIIRPNLGDDMEPKPGASPFVNAVVELPSVKTTPDGKTISTTGTVFVDGAGNNIPVESVLEKRLRGQAIIEAEQIFVGKEQRSLILKLVEVQVLELRSRGGAEATVTSRFRPVVGTDPPAADTDPLALIGPAVKRRRLATVAEYEQAGGAVALVHEPEQHAGEAEDADAQQPPADEGHPGEP